MEQLHFELQSEGEERCPISKGDTLEFGVGLDKHGRAGALDVSLVGKSGGGAPSQRQNFRGREPGSENEDGRHTILYTSASTVDCFPHSDFLSN